MMPSVDLFPKSERTGRIYPSTVDAGMVFEGEKGATIVEYAILTALLIALLTPVAAFVTTAVTNRINNASEIHDGWCIPDPVDAALAALCN